MSGMLALRSRLPGDKWLAAAAGFCLSACVPSVMLSAADTVTATTDSNGVFVVALQSGIWRVEIAHPHFDSLRVAVPTRRFEVPPKPFVAATLWTPSRHTVTRMLCGDSARSDD